MEEIIEILVKIQRQIDYLYNENCIRGDDWMNEVSSEVKDNISKLHQPTVINSVCEHEWSATENFYIKCKKCNQLKNFMQTDL